MRSACETFVEAGSEWKNRREKPASLKRLDDIPQEQKSQASFFWA